MKHSNVAIFVPHNGCPHCCSFCNQVKITGQQKQPTADDVINAASVAMKSKRYNPQQSEIAFFGGSFTAIDHSYMVMLLSAAYKYVKNGSFAGIRISTRPDYIDNEILEILKSYGVTAIELGAQSMCDDVLTANMRGHTAKDVANASKLIKEYGFSLGLQMMTGLYKSSIEKDIYTAEQICSLSPDTVRIYPTIIMADTVLADYYKNGDYNTYSLEETVELCAKLLQMFNKQGIRVIRLGLHSTEDISKGMVAGPWHPSLGELCAARVFRNSIDDYIKANTLPAGCYTVSVNSRDISKMLGQKHSNIEYFAQKGYSLTVKQGNVVQGEFYFSDLTDKQNTCFNKA